jgi:hypothetical protein
LEAGLALLCFSSTTVALLLLGSSLDTPTALTVARVGSAGLLALGVTCWLARGDTQSRAARGLVAAMLLYDIPPSLSSLSPALAFGMKGLWPAVVLHAVMIVWCITHLLRSSLNVTKNGHLQNIPD